MVRELGHQVFLKAIGETGIRLVTELHCEYGCVDWEVSSIVNSYKGNGDALERGNRKGVKLSEHVINVVERMANVRQSKGEH